MGHVPVTIYEAKELSVCFWRKLLLLSLGIPFRMMKEVVMSILLAIVHWVL